MMKSLTVSRSPCLKGCIAVPGDKSISHRSLLLGGLASGKSQIRHFLPGGDCLATLDCLRQMGIKVEALDATTLTIYGRGLHGLIHPKKTLNCVRSGTSMRLLAGVLAGQTFNSELSGENQLLLRPMRRVIDPLSQMGAKIESQEGRAPLKVYGQKLHGYCHELKIASAQVKSALLLAGLFAEGETSVLEPGPSRDHTERMLALMGVPIHQNGLGVIVKPGNDLSPFSINIPGDMSSAAFPLVAGIINPGSQVTLERTGVNPTRTGLLDVLQRMGAEIEINNDHLQGCEPIADITLRGSVLKGIEVGGDTVVRMIDEFPVFMVAAALAEGRTVVHDASELRVKETDRIATAAKELQALGAHVEPLPDGFIIDGPACFKGTKVSSHGDHRLAMALAIAGLAAEGETKIDDIACSNDSYPGFVEQMKQLGAKYD
jgi:3-phosphoshikimate 1-carboxyvinyltransferase